MRASNLHEIVIVCGIGISNACFLCICEINRRYFRELLITLDEIAALIGAIIAVFTTPIAKFFEITRCVGWVINDFTVPIPNC